MDSREDSSGGTENRAIGGACGEFSAGGSAIRLCSGYNRRMSEGPFAQ